MFSIRRWIAAKMFAQAQAQANNNNGRRMFASSSSSSSSCSSARNHHLINTNNNNTLLQFYFADEELNMIASELDSFDGRKDPARCTTLVNQLRAAQDKVISLIFRIMDEWQCEKCCRDYRLKFPDDLLAGGENGESLNGQIWFGAECLAAGSNIMNHETESDLLRPMAKTLTNTLDQLRLELRHCCTDIDDSFFVIKEMLGLDLTCKLENFDRLFSSFEFEYVKAMLPIKTVDDIEKQQDITVLFSETVACALKRGLIAQDEIDECQPNVMINIPRLAIIYGLTRCGEESPVFQKHKDHLSNVFKPFYTLLHKIHALLNALRPIEIEALEKMLINEESLSVSIKESFFTKPDSSVNNLQNHKRRHSAPGSILLHSSNHKTNYCLNSSQVTRSASTVSLMNIISVINQTYSKKPNVNCEDLDNVSIASGGTTTTTSTVDSFEIALALGAKESNYISTGTKELLHRLFVTISGVADQLQCNYASDLRIILRNVFNLYSTNSDETDAISIEEAFEAQEESPQSSESSSSATTPTANVNLTFDNSLWDNDPQNEQLQNLEHGTLPNQTTDPRRIPLSGSNLSNVLLPPIWVPDELVSVCTTCSNQFTMIRRRHHCRKCGQIYCNNCSNHFIPLEQFGYIKPVRVCTPCYNSNISDQ